MKEKLVTRIIEIKAEKEELALGFDNLEVIVIIIVIIFVIIACVILFP